MALRDQIRVMIVDDMSTSRGLLAQSLDGFGIRQVLSAPDGKTALAMIAKTPVHLVLSDYNMPEMDGLHLLHALRSNPATKGIGFILITGTTNPQVIEHDKKLGMNNFIKKPFQNADLLKCIEQVTGRL